MSRSDERLIAVVRHMAASGLSLRAIIAELRKSGVADARGVPVGMERVWEILRACPPAEDAVLLNRVAPARSGFFRKVS